MQQRLIEIDALRGIGVVLMVVFHFLFDYNFFVSQQFNLVTGFFWLVGRLAAVLFLLLVGISLHLRVIRKSLFGKKLVLNFLQRGLFVFALGVLLTILSLVFFPRYAIWFGVLHLIGIATIVSFALVNRPRVAIVLGALVIGIGLLVSLNALTVPHWLAVFPFDFTTFDYFPVFPWLGVVWLGLGLGGFLYPAARARLNLENNGMARKLALLGNNSLAIYFVHQPVLVALVWILAQTGFV